jgi:hypothetical protein
MVYVSMNNTSEGIIEGNTANAGLSDLSPLPIFGGGETRHENAKASKAWGPMKLRHPASNFFMKKLLLIPLLLSNTFGQSYSGYSYDLGNGYRYNFGQIETERKNRLGETSDKSRERTRAYVEGVYQRLAASRQLDELKRQTELLEKIANK